MKSFQMPKSNWRKTSVFTLMFAACLLLFLPGCEGPLGSRDEATGTVSLTIGSGLGRAIMPDFGPEGYGMESFEAFSAVFTREDAQRVDGTVTGNTITAVLPVGGAPWTLTVTAYLDDDEDYPAAEYVRDGIVVVSGPNDLGMVVLRPIIEGDGVGTFAWTLTFPGVNVESGWMSITGGAVPIIRHLPDDATYYWEGEIYDLNVGSYFVVITLTDSGGGEASLSMDLHVFQNLESYFPFTFEPDFFIVPPPVERALANFITVTGIEPAPTWLAYPITEGVFTNVGPLEGAGGVVTWVARYGELILRQSGRTDNWNGIILAADALGGFEEGDIITVTGSVVAEALDAGGREMLLNGDPDDHIDLGTYLIPVGAGTHPFTLTGTVDEATEYDGNDIRIQTNDWNVPSGVENANIATFYIYSITIERSEASAVIRGTPAPTGGTFAISPDPYTAIEVGTLVTLTATADLGYRFVEWVVVSDATVTLDPNATTATVTFDMPEHDVTVNAVFEQLPRFDISTVPSGGGTFSVSADSAPSGATVTLTVDTTEVGFTFDRWEVSRQVLTGGGDGTLAFYFVGPGYVPALPAFTPGLLSVTGNTFEMPDSDVMVRAVFSRDGLDSLVMHGDGSRPGLRFVPLTDLPFSHIIVPGIVGVGGRPSTNWGVGFEMNYAGDATRDMVIRVPRSGLGPDGRAGFGLALAAGQTIDLSGVTALSFYARTSGGTLTIQGMGFGDSGGFGNVQPGGAIHAGWLPGWTGRHNGVVFTGNLDNNNIPVTGTWQRFIVPVPAGITSLDEVNRVFTINAYGWAAASTVNLYLADVEFLMDGVVVDGIAVPASIGPFEVGEEVDISRLFSAAMQWMFGYNNTEYRLHNNPLAMANLQRGWTFEAGHDTFTVHSVGGSDASNIVLTEGNTTIGATSTVADAYLILQNGQGLQTNQVSVTFLEDIQYIILGDFTDMTGLIQDAGFWQIYSAGSRFVEAHGRPSLLFMRPGGGNAWFNGIGIRGQTWNLSAFDYISFYVRDGFGSPGTPVATTIGTRTLRFLLETAEEVFYFARELTTQDRFGAIDEWVNIRIPLRDFVGPGVPGTTPINLATVVGWRIHLMPYHLVDGEQQAATMLGAGSYSALFYDIRAIRADDDGNGP